MSDVLRLGEVTLDRVREAQRAPKITDLFPLEDAQRLLRLAELGERSEPIDPANGPALAALRLAVVIAERDEIDF